MAECSTLSQNLPSGSGLCGIKRSHSSDDSDDASIPTKVFKNDIRRLIDSPERHTDPGSETEFSFQEEETDLCCRSSETSSSDWSQRNAVGHVEFEIRSPNEGPNPFGDSSTASDASVNELQIIGLPPPKTWDDVGNTSCASSGSSDVFDPEIPRRDYWTCLQCSNVNNRPAFRYCEKCYKVRRDMYQPRVKPRKRRKRKNSKGVGTARNFTAGKANSDRTTGANKFQANSTTFGDSVKSCDSSKMSPVAFTGIKLESCSQENRDSGMACSQSSGVACSQGTVASGLPAIGSDSSLSPDSGADTGSFLGIKLSSTRVPALKPLLLCRAVDIADSLWPSLSQAVDEVDALQSSVSQSVDEADAVQPSVSRNVDEVDAVQPLVSRTVVEVDAVRPSMSRSVDEVDAVQPSMSRSVDEVDAVQPSTSRTVDVVDAVQPSTSRSVDEVYAVWPSANGSVDEVDAVQPSASRNLDEVDAVQSSAGRSVDEVDAVQPSASRSVDEVNAVRPMASRSVDEVDAVRPTTSRSVDEVDAVRPTTSRSVDEVDAVRPTTSRSVDEVDAVRPLMSRGVDEVDAVQPSVSRSVDEVDAVRPSKLRSVKTQTDLCFVSKSEVPKEKPIVDVDKCMTCYSRPLDGIFVHSTYAHMCCCYKCTVKVWKTTKRCPICNCKVMNVLRLFKGC